MASAPDPFVTHCVELLGGPASARSRRMFGGHGLYIDDLFVAIVADGVLYLKADEQTRTTFEQAGGRPFVYDRRTGAVALGYWSAPEDASDSPALMAPWVRMALAAALRARAAGPRRVRPARGSASGGRARR